LHGYRIYLWLQSRKADESFEIMAILTVRNLPDEVHRALRVRAAQHGRSEEAEVREILEAVVKPQKRVRMGEALAYIGRKIGLTTEDFAVFENVRDKTPAKPLSFDWMIVLDTNVVSESMKPEPDAVVMAWLNDQAAEILYLSTITLAELLFGIRSLPAGKREII